MLCLAAVAIAACGLDQLSKFLIVRNLQEGETTQVIGNILQFHFVRNPGAAFSLASGSTWIFSTIAVLVVVFIAWYARKIHSIAWSVLVGMLLGGTVGNLIDRFFREPSFGLGHVIDFIQVWGFPAIFNVADSFIVSSMGLFLILTIRGVKLDGSRATQVSGDLGKVQAGSKTAPDRKPAKEASESDGL
ncbi:MAG: signal peptidase II [Cryobacterium sp.]|nr:signal peptidase II [Cryobacterium sp.]